MSLHCIVWCCRVLYCWLRRAGCISQDTYLLYVRKLISISTFAKLAAFVADFPNPDLDMLHAPITAKAEFWASAQTFAQRERGMLLNWNNNGVERELAQEWKTFYSIMPLLQVYSMNKEEFAFRINITTGKMSQTITPFHSFDYFNCLVKVICCSFITKLNNVALVLKCVHC